MSSSNLGADDLDEETKQMEPVLENVKEEEEAERTKDITQMTKRLKGSPMIRSENSGQVLTTRSWNLGNCSKKLQTKGRGMSLHRTKE